MATYFVVTLVFIQYEYHSNNTAKHIPVVSSGIHGSVPGVVAVAFGDLPAASG